MEREVFLTFAYFFYHKGDLEGTQRCFLCGKINFDFSVLNSLRNFAPLR